MILFKLWKRKKDTPKEAFALKSYKEQLSDYYKNNDWTVNTSDIDKIVYQGIKDKLSINEINDIISDLLILKPLNYEIVLEKLNTESYFWKSRCSSCLSDEIDIARKSLNIGDFIGRVAFSNTGSCAVLVNYLNKENREFQLVDNELFFDQYRNSVTS